ncbi:MAG: AIM24 family protein, partial [Actinomycetales bacterium]
RHVAKTAGGFMNAMKSGEGFVVEMTGPGRVWTQSRNPNGLINWLTQVLPFTRA